MNTLFPSAWLDLLPADTQQQIVNIESKIADMERIGMVVYPPAEDRYAALNIVSPEQCKVVIIGQDPYHGEGEAMGLCFSVREGFKQPPSLKNIFKELNDDLGFAPPISGDLTYWAQQGVLLLNTALSVEKDKAASHKDIGWKNITSSLVHELSTQQKNIVFVLWGTHAKSLKKFIAENDHEIIESSHPSPIHRSCDKGFFGSKSFSRANNALARLGKTPVDWNLSRESPKTEAPEIIAFTKVSLPYGWLGNMSAHPVTYENETYKSTEALYQALKFHAHPHVQALIRAEKSPLYAKKVAKEHEHMLPSQDQESLNRQNIDNMRICLRLKIEQHQDIKAWLLDTGSSKIVEDCSKRQEGSGLYWGAALVNGAWKGRNILGKLWMNERSLLRGLEEPYPL